MWTAENEKRMRADIAASEQIAREQGIPPRRVTLTYEDAAGALAEIERLTAELAARAPADASPEARAKIVEDTLRTAGVSLLVTHPADESRALQAVVRAVDASRPAANWTALRDTFTKLVHVDHMARHLCENSGIDHTKDPPEATVDVADLTALGGALDAVDPTEEHDEDQRDRLMAVLGACETSADASRPGLTEEQIRALVKAAIEAKCAQGMADMRVCIAEHELTCAIAAALLRASRGETFEVRHPDGTRDRVEPPDPRATLHDGNPESPFAPGSLAAGSATEDRILDRKRGGK